jgi:RHS repeat-associated protein
LFFGWAESNPAWAMIPRETPVSILAARMDGPNVIVQRTRERVNGGAWTTYYVLSDPQGNVIALATADGTLVAEYDYDPYGRLIRETGPKAASCTLRYSTKYRDPDLDLYYYGYRWYDAAAMKWLTPDPIGERGGANLTAFCSADPINQVDPLGLLVGGDDLIFWSTMLGFYFISTKLAWTPSPEDSPEWMEAVERAHQEWQLKAMMFVIALPVSSGLGKWVGDALRNLGASRAVIWLGQAGMEGASVGGLVNLADQTVDARPGVDAEELLRAAGSSAGGWIVLRGLGQVAISRDKVILRKVYGAVPTGGEDVSLQRFILEQVHSKAFRAKAATYAKVTRSGPIDWEGFERYVRLCRYVRFGSVREATSLGYFGPGASGEPTFAITE